MRFWIEHERHEQRHGPTCLVATVGLELTFSGHFTRERRYTNGPFAVVGGLCLDSDNNTRRIGQRLPDREHTTDFSQCLVSAGAAFGPVPAQLDRQRLRLLSLSKSRR